MTTKVVKPKKKKRSAILDWHEVTEFIEKKYKKDVRDWSNWSAWNSLTPAKQKKVPKPEYQDFWHLICDSTSNGGTLILCPDEALADEELPQWQREIYTILKNEFGGGDLEFLTAW